MLLDPLVARISVRSLSGLCLVKEQVAAAIVAVAVAVEGRRIEAATGVGKGRLDDTTVLTLDLVESQSRHSGLEHRTRGCWTP